MHSLPPPPGRRLLSRVGLAPPLFETFLRPCAWSACVLVENDVFWLKETWPVHFGSMFYEFRYGKTCSLFYTCFYCNALTQSKNGHKNREFSRRFAAHLISKIDHSSRPRPPWPKSWIRPWCHEWVPIDIPIDKSRQIFFCAASLRFLLPKYLPFLVADDHPQPPPQKKNK